jgi:hypothetical protein
MATSLEKWQSITQDPRVVEFFKGLFENIGIRVTDTKEEFTCHHRGDHIEFTPGVIPAEVDYTVELQSFQVDRLAGQARTGSLDEAEQYRIVSTLFTPATAATLKHPVLANPLIRRLMGAEDLIHVELKSPGPQEPDAQHTLIYANRQWLVFPGLHGRPRRIYRLSLAEALEYHRKVFASLKVKKWSSLVAYASWYRRWRKQVSSRV